MIALLHFWPPKCRPRRLSLGEPLQSKASFCRAQERPACENEQLAAVLTVAQRWAACLGLQPEFDRVRSRPYQKFRGKRATMRDYARIKMFVLWPPVGGFCLES
jgi:hypothetical protein